MITVKHLAAAFFCVVFGVLFSPTSSQSNNCIGFCGNTSNNLNTCPPNFVCLNNAPNGQDQACCPIPPQRCIDHNVNCPIWAAQGFCTNTFWNAANKLACRKSCGLCTVAPTATCFDKNTTAVTFNGRNTTLCEVWARNGYCGSAGFYGNFLAQNCNYSCGCTPLPQTTTVGMLIAGSQADLGPCNPGTACVSGPTCLCPAGQNCINNECFAIPGPFTCASLLGQNIGPFLDVTSCPTGTGINGVCCQLRDIPQFTCTSLLGQANGAACATNADCGGTATCINNFCCATT